MTTSWIAPGSVERLVLTGDGGDEAFGGYERFPAAMLADRVPFADQRGAGTVARLLPRTGTYHGFRCGLERFAGEPDLPVLDRYLSWIAVFERRTLERVVSRELAQGAEFSTFASHREEFERAGDVHSFTVCSRQTCARTFTMICS
jgi:asparagine synthetase B (glutamine-hydrolysing)